MTPTQKIDRARWMNRENLLLGRLKTIEESATKLALELEDKGTEPPSDDVWFHIGRILAACGAA